MTSAFQIIPNPKGDPKYLLVKQLGKYSCKADAERTLKELRQSEKMPDDRSADEREVQGLRSELWYARREVLSLTPFADQFDKYYLCKNEEQWMRWWYETIKTILNSTSPDPELSNNWIGKRACCPLCRGGNSWHHDGFSLPEGLKRHLEGKSKAHQCSIMKHAHDLSRDHLREQAQVRR